MIFDRIRARLRQSVKGGLWRGASKLLAGTVLARLIALVSVPILARLYSPAEHGVLAIFTSLITILAPILSLRYSLVVPLPRRDGTALNAFMLSFWLNVILAVILALVLWGCGPWLLGNLSMDPLQPWWYLIVLGAYVASTYELFTMWATRKQNYGLIARTKVTQSAFGEAIKIAMGLLDFRQIGLLIGYIVSQGAGIGTMWRGFHQDYRACRRQLSGRRMWQIAKSYAGFPGYRLTSQLLLAFSVQAPLIFMAALYGPSLTGQLGLAMMALSLPISLVGQAIGQAFYGEIARLPPRSGAKIERLTVDVQKRLFMAGLPFSVALYFFAEPMFSIILGRDWQIAGRYAEYLAPFVLMQLVSAPLMQVINVLRTQRLFLIINILRAFGIFGLYLFATNYSLSPDQFVNCVSIFLFIFYALTCIFVMSVVHAAAKRDGK